MKTTIFVTVLATSVVALAAAYLPFRGWSWTEEKSSDIVIVRCMKTPSRDNYRGGIRSDIGIEFVLKGRTNLGPAHLSSFYWPRQGEYYLIFSVFDEEVYHATEEFRIIPLGVDFSTNSIVGKPLDEQIRILFERRLWQLNRELEQGQEEKKRLEGGLKK